MGSTFANQGAPTRRYDIDALRVGAFCLLIFYHIGMFYVSWGWHVKSTYAGDNGGGALEPFMRLLNPWRLPLLFLISGVALRFALEKASGTGSFAMQRSGRLLIALLFGMLFIVPPQSWLQLVESGEVALSYGQFYGGYLDNEFSITTPTWNHLWYVAYMFVYTLVISGFASEIGRVLDWISERLSIWGVLAVFLVPHAIIRVTLDPHFPTTHDLTSDWANHAHSFLWVLTGYALAKSDRMWSQIGQIWRPCLIATLLLGSTLTVVWLNWGWFETRDIPLWTARFGRVAYTGLVLMTLLGLAQHVIKNGHPILSWMGQCVFCWYILHQTLIILIGYHLTPFQLGFGGEFITLIGLTTLSTLGLTEVVRRIPGLRVALGFKPKERTARLYSVSTKARGASGGAIVSAVGDGA